MLDPHRLGGLAGAAGFLCSAHDELVGAGYGRLSRELRDLIDLISLEIAWLEAVDAEEEKRRGAP